MNSECWLKYAVHPWSHSWPINKRDPDAKVGKMCALVADAGSSGISRFAVWVEVMVFLFGSSTWMPFGLGLMLITGTSQ